MENHALSRHIAHAARELREVSSAQDTMDKTVALAVALVEHADAAGISLVHRDHHIDTPAATHDAARRVDELQYEFGAGPCLDAIRDQDVVHSSDLKADDRWGRWGARVFDETSIRSMMCFRLFTNEHTVGALNLYARTTNAFDRDDLDTGLALAAHAAVAVAAAQQLDQLTLARDHRTVIGQAQGILMERYGLTDQQAFHVLARISSHTNVKLRQVAAEIVKTRQVPGVESMP